MSRPRQKQLSAAYPSHKGGRIKLSGSGHIEEEVYCPHCRYHHFEQQHRMIMEDHLGYRLPDDLVVHHKNHIKTDNRLENLQVMTKSEHMKIHALDSNLGGKLSLSEDQVSEALRGRSTLEAAEILAVNHQTLRNRFDHLLSKRRTPHNPFDAHVIEMVRIAAQDPTVDVKTFAKQTGIAAQVTKRICEANGIDWIKKSRKGERRRTYRGKPTIRELLERDGHQTETGIQSIDQ